MALKPHSRKKADNRVLSTDYLWAARITKRILADCHPWQLSGVVDPARRLSFCVGRGGAKTTTERARALLKLIWLRNQYIGYAATSKEHARNLNWNKIKQTCENYGMRMSGEDPDVTFLESSMLMTCRRTGSTYQLRGVEDVADAEKFRGFPQTEFQVDECGSFKPELFSYLLTQCVSPRLGEALALPPGLLEFIQQWNEDDVDGLEAYLAPIVWEDHRGGCIVLASTPPRHIGGEFYEVTREGSTRHRPYSKRAEYPGWLGYSSHAWTLKDVVDLPDSKAKYPALFYNWQEALREKAEKQWSDDNPIWKREYLGLWAADDTDTMFRYRAHVDGKEWNQWDPIGKVPTTMEDLRAVVKILRDRFDDVRFVTPADEGYKDPFALNVFAFSPRDPERQIFHVFPFERTEMYGRPIAELLLGTDQVAAILSTGKFPQKYGGIYGALNIIAPDAAVMDGSETLIAELANVYGIRFAKADRKPDSKVGGIELVNGDLQDGRIKILKDSPLERQIRVLQWKEDEFGQKKEDKAQANHCLAAGTMVMTEDGERAIETIRVGDRVHTRRGLRFVTFAGQTDVAETVTRLLPSGRTLTGTHDHRVFVGGHWIPLELLTPSAMVCEWESTDHLKSSSSTASNTDDIHMEQTSPCLDTSRLPMGSSFIALSGVPRMDLFQRGCMSIIETAITRTTPSKISSSSTDASTSACTDDRRTAQHSRAIDSSGSRNRQLPHGMAPMMESNGIEAMRLSQSIVSGCASATSVALSSPLGQPRPNDAAPSASDWRTTHGCVRTEPVFDLSVEGEHEFFANGVIVSNSTDTLIYGRKLIAHLFEAGAVTQDAKPTPEAYKDPMGLEMNGEITTEDENAGLLTDPTWSDSDEEWG